MPKNSAFLRRVEKVGLGAEVFLPICQSNQVSHTGADATTRILGQPTFVGQIAPGRRVVIVDDVATFGSTLANLRGWIEHQGAHLIRATTLGATFGGTKLRNQRMLLPSSSRNIRK